MAEGRTALTEFRLLAAQEGLALLEACPRTGRTHQIRVHLSADGLPIVGDSTYGGQPAPRLMLHCVGLSFTGRNGRPIVLRAAPDKDFVERCAGCWSESAAP